MRNSLKGLIVGGVVTATLGLAGAPALAAAGGPPEGGGGCHMVFSPSSTGLSEMMANASATGSARMVDMLGLFSQEPFCGA